MASLPAEKADAKPAIVKREPLPVYGYDYEALRSWGAFEPFEYAERN